MNSIVLFFGNFLFACFSYNFSKQKYLSPTFLSASMFALISLEYYCFINVIGSDVSSTVVWIVLFSEVFISMGEWVANHTTLHKNRNNCYVNHALTAEDIVGVDIPIYTTVLFSFLSLVTFLLRLIKLAHNYGGGNLLLIISGSRYSVARGEFSYGVILALLYYIVLVAAYLYVLVFVQKIIFEKKLRLTLLLPVVGYCLCAITTTARTEFIKLACVFVAAVFVCNSLKRRRKIKLYKFVIAGGVFAVFFLWYGFAIRGVSYSGSNSIVSNIVGYSCSSLYGLGNYLDNPWNDNEMFGMYTLNNIYNLFGKNVSVEYEPTYFMAMGKSNIYTSLNKPIQDYGVVGMLVTRFMLAYVAVKIQNISTKVDIGCRKFFLLFIIVCHNVYIFLMAPIGDKAYLFYLNPKYLVELFIAFEIVFLFGMRIQYQTDSGFIQVKGVLNMREKS